MSIVLIIVGFILILSFLVLTHEYGHFIMARRNGVEVEEFSLFFPPRIYKRKTKAGWQFSIGLIPMGGFVKMKGEHDADTAKGTFGAATTWAKTKIMAAGVVVNLVTALILFTILALIGMPQLVPNQFALHKNAPNSDGNMQRVAVDQRLVSHRVLIGDVESGSPAARAGLQPEDEIIDIGLSNYSPVGVTNADKLPDITKNFAGQTVTVYYTRHGHDREARATLLSKQVVDASQKTDNPKGYLGIVPEQLTIQRSTWSAPIVAVGLSGQLTALTFQGLGHALGGLGSLLAGLVTGNTAARQHGQTSATSQVGGPIAIFFIIKDGWALGHQFILFIIAYIALTLAIMNILPIPALDGGRLWLTLLSRAIRRPLSAQREEAINAIGFILIIGLVILISIVDIHRFF